MRESLLHSATKIFRRISEPQITNKNPCQTKAYIEAQTQYDFKNTALDNAVPANQQIQKNTKHNGKVSVCSNMLWRWTSSLELSWFSLGLCNLFIFNGLCGKVSG